MQKSKSSETQVVSILKQANADVPVKDRCGRARINSARRLPEKSTHGGQRICGVSASWRRRTPGSSACTRGWPSTARRCRTWSERAGRNRRATRRGSSLMCARGAVAGPARWSTCRDWRGPRRRWTGRCALQH